VRGLFQFPVAGFIAILVGLWGDRAMAQPIRPLPVFALAATDFTPELVSAPTTAKLFESALAKLQTLSPHDDLSVGDIRTFNSIALRSTQNPSLSTETIKGNAIGLVGRADTDIFSNFIGALRKSLVGTELVIQKHEAPTPATVVGVASTYNPYRYGIGSGGKQTASGEPYDPAAWTAAIRIDLREQFGGVRYGKNYRPTFALVEAGNKTVIVKINDVGPLKPGRVIDLNERSMSYFDPTQQLGLIDEVKVTLLRDDNWTPGPVASEKDTVTQ